MSWEDAMVLGKDETVVHNWHGNYEFGKTVMVQKGRRTRSQEVKRKKEGVLILTNQRLFWLEKRGSFRTSYHAVFEIPLEKLMGVSMGGTLQKYVSITGPEGVKMFHLRRFGSKELEPFKKIVFGQVEARKQQLDEEKRKERVHILLDFSSVMDYMKKGGLVMQAVKCPECQGPVELPDSGSQVACERCGSTIYATDIFEKIKALIG